MRRFLLPSALLVIPSIALALDYTDISSRYTDSPFSRSEAAGISVLTDIGAVSGNPDGSFAAGRTLNRAEFLKIALLSADREITDANGCFPDTPASAWFTQYICTAKNMGVVEGNPDGLFHPERDVNYAEAAKMLVGLFDLPIPEPAPNERWAWYTGYLRAAENAGVSLPESVSADTFLTRGQMARLAAAFVAEAAGELAEYRAFEQGQLYSSSSRSSSSISSSKSSVSSVSTVSSSSSTSSSSSSVSASSIALFPAISRFAVAGTTTATLTDGFINVPSEDVRLQTVEIELRDEVQSVEGFELVNENGTVLADLIPQFYSNNDDTKWRADIAGDAGAVLSANTTLRVGIRARMRTSTGGALSNEVMEIRSVQVATEGVTSGQLYYFAPLGNQILTHQTSFGRVTMIHNDLGNQLQQQAGADVLIGRFAVTGESAKGMQSTLETLFFALETTDVSAANIRIRPSGNILSESGCAIENQPVGRMIVCAIDNAADDLSPVPVVYDIIADLGVASAKQSGTLKLNTVGPGSVTEVGAASWSDGVNAFSWIESNRTVEGGPLVTVTK